MGCRIGGNSPHGIVMWQGRGQAINQKLSWIHKKYGKSVTHGMRGTLSVLSQIYL